MKTIITFFTFLFFANAVSQISTLGTNTMTSGGTTTTLAAAAPIVDPPPPAPNAIEFSYDNAGNQTKRTWIYIAPSTPRMANAPQAIITEENLLQTDLYEEVKYYPNPVKSELYLQWIEVDNKDLQTIELYDLNGRLMQRYPNQTNNESTTIDFDKYPAGYYNLILLYTTGDSKNLKIIKQ